MAKLLTFDDVLIKPQFSYIKSRKDVSLYSRIQMWGMNIPIISANMDTVTGIQMAHAMIGYGASACLHRFWGVDDNVEAFMACPINTAVSIGLGDRELERAEALIGEGAYNIVIDVAHGAQQSVVDQLRLIKEKFPHTIVTVGNFATGESFNDFCHKLGSRKFIPDAVKVGIGPGSACTTRIKTGCGIPQLTALFSVGKVARQRNISVIADGGMRTPGDIAKALAAGANAVMVGGMLAGTEETPGKAEYAPISQGAHKIKRYRGSASKESYEAQGKDETWRAAEGESFTVPYKGPVKNILADIEGGLKSALTYVGANNLESFRSLAKFVEISPSSILENGAHGKN